MSLLVSFKGQFSPLQLEVRRPMVQRPQEVLSPHETKPVTDFVDQNSTQHQSPKKTSIQNYLKNSAKLAPSIIQVRASEIMTRKVLTIHEDAGFDDLQDFFKNYTYRHILVENSNNEIIGIISDRDYLKALSQNSNFLSGLNSIMTEKVFFASEHSTIQEISRLMFYEKISCVPVANKDYKLVGIVTSTDILKFLISTHSIDNII